MRANCEANHEIPDVDVAAARTRMRLTQTAFTRAFGVKLATLRNWEQGRTRPEGPARVLLAVIDSDPRAVMKAIAARPTTAGAHQ